VSDTADTLADRINKQNAERAQAMIEASKAEQAQREAERLAERSEFNQALRGMLTGAEGAEGEASAQG